MSTMSNNGCFDDFAEHGNIYRGLPAVAYNSDAFYACENQFLFPSSWVFVGFAHEMPKQGDVIPVTVAQKPVLLVRGTNGDIKAFHNVCRHRCLKLVDAPGNAGRLIRCPYHSWSYELDGSLRAAPFFGGMDNQQPAGFNFKDNGLVGIRCQVWQDWIFVNLDGQAMPFNAFIDPLATRLAGLDFDSLKPVEMLEFGVVNTNWKFLMENFIEPYHVQFVHSRTTDQPLSDHSAFVDRHCLGSAVKIAEHRHVSESADTLAVDSNYLTLFPNFVLATYAPDQIGVHLNTPVSAGETSQRRVIYLLRDSDVAAEEISKLKKLWWKVHKEDHEMCERLQLGRASSVADQGGWLSPQWETSVRRFQELVYESTREQFR